MRLRIFCGLCVEDLGEAAAENVRLYIRGYVEGRESLRRMICVI